MKVVVQGDADLPVLSRARENVRIGGRFHVDIAYVNPFRPISRSQAAARYGNPASSSSAIIYETKSNTSMRSSICAAANDNAC
jgi:hypothetical protein